MKNGTVAPGALPFFLACAGLIAILSAVVLLLPTAQVATRFTSDDGYFYLVVARNAAEGRFSSFDGETLTNGYHPLWAVSLALLRLAVPADEGFFRAALALHALLLMLSVALLWRLVAHRARASAPAIAAGVFAALVATPSWQLTEAALAVCLCLGFFALLGSRGLEQGRLEAALCSGVLAGLCVLARLDSVFVVGPALAALLVLRARPALWAVASAAACVGPYLLWNRLTFGHWVPISGAIKSSFPFPHWSNLPLTAERSLRVFVPLLLAAATLARARTLPAGRLLRVCLGAGAAGSLLFGVYELAFQRDAAWGLYSWHFAVPSALAAATSPLALGRRLARGANALAAVLLAASFAFGAVKALAPGRRDASLRELYEAGVWVRGNLSAGQVVAATDAGLVGYFGGRRTVNLDGLINNFDYQAALRDGRVAEYLAARGVTHVCAKLSPAAAVQQRLVLPLPARLHPGSGDAIVLCAADRVFLTRGGGVGVWRWPAGPCR